MRFRYLHLLFALLFSICCAPSAYMEQSESGQDTQRSFFVFDSINYLNKPDLTPLGMKPIHVIYAGSYWGTGESRLEPRENPVRTEARKAARLGHLTCIDIEHWPTHVDADDETVQESLERYLRVVRWTRDAQPGLRIGFYSMIPARDYWNALGKEQDVKKWQQSNERLTPLAQEVDVIFPSVYTFYDDQEGWEQYARANLAEARKYGKPVYAFIWPRFHNSNKTLGGQDIPGDYWRRQLEVCFEEADGVVIWTDRGATWDPQAPWWLATLEFLEAHNIAGE